MERGGRHRPLVWTLVVLVAVGVVAAVGASAFLVLRFRAHTAVSSAMEPALRPGSRFITEKVDPADLRRGDVVLYDMPGRYGGPVVSRITAVGGDRLTCCDGPLLTLNGAPYQEPYLTGGHGSEMRFSVTVPPGRFFMMGDDRSDSLDSRFFRSEEGEGSVPASAVLGRVVWASEGDLGTSRPASLKAALAVSGGGLLLLLGAGGGLAAVLRRAARWRPGAADAGAAGPWAAGSARVG